jgi:hypothetical protein
MKERVTENWLISANERTLEVPFCQLLTGEGYRVLHLTRHGEMEQGKDILALDPNGQPCAFQLKNVGGGKITQRDWETFKHQIDRLVELPIKHPSVPENVMHRPILVANGELDEPVRIEIVDRNRAWTNKGYPTLETVLLGDLLTRFNLLQSNFWPIEPFDVKELLEIFLSDGRACFNKQKFADFLYSNLPFEKHGIPKAEYRRSFSSAAIFTSYALSSYQGENNYVAEVEGWIMYIAYLLSLAERENLEPEYWLGSLNLAEFAVFQSLQNLTEHLSTRNELIEGDSLVDGPFYRPRITWLCSLLSAFGLWLNHINKKDDLVESITKFIKSNRDKLLLWGEAAVPQIVSIIWFLRNTLPTQEPDSLLVSLISGITSANLSEGKTGLPDPYHDIQEVLRNNLGLNETGWQEHFAGRSYSLEVIVQLYTRRNWKQTMRWLWPEISRIDFASFTPREKWQYYLWHCDEGDFIARRQNMTQSWSALRRDSSKIDDSKLPVLIKNYPWLLLLFCIVYPHRFTVEIAKHLDNAFSKSW